MPRINGEIPSIDEATSDHERLLNRYYNLCFRFSGVKKLHKLGRKRFDWMFKSELWTI